MPLLQRLYFLVIHFSDIFQNKRLISFCNFLIWNKKIKDKKPRLKCISYLFIFYILAHIFTFLINLKYISGNFNTNMFILTAGAMGFILVLDDVVAEVYGIKKAVYFYFSMVLIRLTVASFLYTLYSNLMLTKYLLFIAFYHPITFTFAWYANVNLLTKWKFLMHGKYFWLRSLGASAIGILIICLLSIPEDLKFSNWSFHQIFYYDFFFSNILIGIFIILFAFVGNFIVKILKVIEFSNNPKTHYYFNPFKEDQNVQSM